MNYVKKIISFFYQKLIFIDAFFNHKKYITQSIQQPKIAKHTTKEDWIIENFDLPDVDILEVGSREVSGTGKLRNKLTSANYTGFDLYPGENVDITGDVHELSKYFDKQFDVIYCSACFEHFAMPWLVAEEITKLLKISGHLIIETHFSFRAHERPWNFFQFSDHGLKILFNEMLGYECLDSGMSNPIVARFSLFSDDYLKLKPIGDMYCHSTFVGIKKFDNPDFKWSSDTYYKIVKDTYYPAPKKQ